jgi:tyrosyl-tRNA synthetase
MGAYGLEPQVILTMPLLEGLDGVEKMSKSLGNYVGIEEPAREIFGKVMSIPDALMWRWWELCTDLSLEGIKAMKEQVASGGLHPRAAKVGLAMRLAADFHGEQAAREASAEFDRIFAQKDLPDEIPEVALACSREQLPVVKLLALLKLAASNTQARDLIDGGGVSLDGARVGDTKADLDVSAPRSILVKVGKRRFVKAVFS